MVVQAVALVAPADAGISTTSFLGEFPLQSVVPFLGILAQVLFIPAALDPGSRFEIPQTDFARLGQQIDIALELGHQRSVGPGFRVRILKDCGIGPPPLACEVRMEPLLLA